MLHFVALALHCQVCGIRTLVTSVLSAAALAAAIFTTASAPAAAQPQAKPQAQPQSPAAAEAFRPTEPAAATTRPAPQAVPASTPIGVPLPPVSGRRVVAVLLPLESPAFGRAAAHVRNGLSAAWSQSAAKGQIELRFIPVGDQPNDVIAAYNVALAAGAQAIVGPLVRDQVIALANGLAQSAPVSVPTMALNIVEGVPRLVPNLFLFGLSAESEARQVARLALREGHKRALVLAQPNLFSRRQQQAFIEAFSENGGSVVAQHAAVTDLGAMNRMRAATANSGADMVFFAADLATARTVRPFLENQLATYATSQLWSGPIDPNANLDLNGTRLLDMPWLLEPDHAAVMVFPRSQPALSPENERLYALGIDAFRLAEIAVERGIRPGLSLDGVTGRITLERGNWLVREAVPAQIWQGRLVPGTERR